MAFDNSDFEPLNEPKRTLGQVKAAIYGQESASGRADTSRMNPQGVTGPMQVKKETFEGLKKQGVIPATWEHTNPAHNKAAGDLHVEQLYNKFDGDYKKVSAAYYAGEKAVDKNGRIIPYRNLQRPSDPSAVQYGDQVGQKIRKAAADFDLSDFEPVQATQAQEPAPAAPQAPAAPPKPERSFGERAGTFIRGAGESLTAGVIKYPQAALMAATGGPSYKESLASLRGDNARMAKDDPAAYYGGQVAGGLVSAPVMGGATLGQLALRGAVQGGIQGFTENDYTDAGDALVDVTKGASIGGALGAVARVPGKAQEYVVRKTAQSNLRDYAARNQQGADEALEALTALNPKLKGMKDEKLTAAVERMQKKQPDLAMDYLGGTEIAAQQRQQANKIMKIDFKDVTHRGDSYGASNLNMQGAITSLKDFGRTLVPGARGVFEGALFGGAGAAATGQDWKQGAAFGASAGGLLRLKTDAAKAALKVAGAATSTAPNALGNISQATLRPTVATAVPAVVGTAPAMTHQEYLDAYDAAGTVEEKVALGKIYEESKKKTSRLGRLAEEFKSSVRGRTSLEASE